MRDAIRLILLGAFAAPAMVGCSDEPNPNQNVIITENVPADAEVEALPVDEGGMPEPEADSGADDNRIVNSH